MKNNILQLKNIIVVCVFLFFLYLSFFAGRSLDEQGGFSAQSLECCALAGVLCALTFGLMRLFGKKQTMCPDLRRVGFGRVSIKTWAIISGILMIAWIPVFAAYYPGIFSYDANGQMLQVINSEYSTHHPLIHTLWLGLCVKLTYSGHDINSGVALYSISQMIIMAIILGWTAAEIYRQSANRVFLVFYSLFLAVFPVNSVMVISVTKDVVFSGLTVVFVLLTIRYSDEKTIRVSDEMTMTVIVSLVVLFRKNALYAFALLVVVMLLGSLLQNKKGIETNSFVLIRPIIIGMAVAVLLGLGLKVITGARTGSPKEAISIPLQQMARVRIVHDDELTDNEKDTLERLLGQNVVKRYNEHLADPVKEDASSDYPAELIRVWIKMGLQYPGTYLDAWLYTCEGAWYIFDRSVNRIYGEGSETGYGYLSTETRGMPEAYRVVSQSYAPGLRDVMERIVSDNVFERFAFSRLLFSPALYAWIIFAFGCIGFIYRDYGTIRGVGFLFAYYVTVLLGPAILVRYMYPFMVGIAVLFAGRLRIRRAEVEDRS